VEESREVLKKRIEKLEVKVQALQTDLIHDPLTGLKTRSYFEDEAKVYLDSLDGLQKKQRKQSFGFTNVSFIFFDIDFFKKINDTHGHLVGDKVLESVAAAIQSSLREWDTAARWGGEEIVATLVGAMEEDAKNKAEDIRNHVENIEFENNPELRVTLSAGVASAESGLALQDVLKRADKALYKAKETGRNKVVAYSEI